jgi:hypothetical protein
MLGTSPTSGPIIDPYKEEITLNSRDDPRWSLKYDIIRKTDDKGYYESSFHEFMRVNVYNDPDPWDIPSIKMHRFALVIEFCDELILKDDYYSAQAAHDKHCIEKIRTNFLRRIQSTSVHKRELHGNEQTDAVSDDNLTKYLSRDVDSLLSGEDLKR